MENKLRIISKLKQTDNPVLKPSPVLMKSLAKLSNIPEMPASNKTLDLKYLQGVFVTSGMNANGDVFTPAELFRSFRSVIMKPVNIEHRMTEGDGWIGMASGWDADNTIVGCIYDAVFVDEAKGITISASEYDSLSDEVKREYLELDEITDSKYHVVIAAVLWHFVFPKTLAFMEEAINWGEVAISMEALFTHYDFSVGKSIYTKEEHPEYDSFLSQGLSIGPHKIGRVLRNILFSAGGLVANPANPDAFEFIETFAKNSKDVSVCASIVLDKPGEYKMDLTQLIETNATLNANMKQLNEELFRIKDTLAQKEGELSGERAVASELKQKLQTLNAELETLRTSTKEVIDAKSNLETELDDAKASVKDLTDKVATLEATASTVTELRSKLEAAEGELNVIKAATLAAERKTALEDKGIYLDELDTESALASMDEASFNAVVLMREKVLASVTKAPGVPLLIKGDGVDGMKAFASQGNKAAEIKDLLDLMKKVK